MNITKLGRFSLVVGFGIWFILLSSLLRLGLMTWHFSEVSWYIIDLVKTLGAGLFFDLGTYAFVCFPSVLYITFFPNRFAGTIVDKIAVYFFSVLTLFILVFTFFAEITFWEEFGTRFNFIAVDYLIYTHEVISNIEESYPLPYLISGISIITALFVYVFHVKKLYTIFFNETSTIKQKGTFLATVVVIMITYITFVNNSQAEWSQNSYNSEISKSGIYSFFAAFRNNQMLYPNFYTAIEDKDAFAIIRAKLAEPNAIFQDPTLSIKRTIVDTTLNQEKNKNVVFILVESLSAEFMKEFGNDKGITPFIDSLAQKSIFFNNLYATGTRTVRGMEAVTLCIPPTPGQSIVKRPENHNLFTISNVFKSKKYDCNFFYGGDGYFDNMNSYFGGNGFNIYDRGRGSVLSDDIKMTRNNINDNEVTFENAWGICDEDVYDKMIRVTDTYHAQNKPFFNFVMTTSNHRPYTYPGNKIDIPSGSGREGAVKYTDYALCQLFEKARKKPWYKNTVFVIVADHCASSAGKNVINVANYHIPAMIVNMPDSYTQKVEKQCSQIDIMPTLFRLLNWDYSSNFFGKNVLKDSFEPRTFVATYRKLALMKGEQIMILSDQKKQDFYTWDAKQNNLNPLPMNQTFLNETISWYQTADYLFTNKKLK